MLRTTAARAFTTLAGRAVLDREPAAPQSRREAVDRLFYAMQRTFADRSREARFRDAASRAEKRDGRGRSSRGGEFGPPDPRVSDVRAVLTGVEFALTGQGASYRFLNTRRGVISVEDLRKGRLRRLEVISVERGEGGYRAIRKLPSRRGGYLFDSVGGIVDSYLRAAARTRRGGEAGGNVERDEGVESGSAVCRADPTRNLAARAKVFGPAAAPLPTDGLPEDGPWTRG